MKSCKGLTAILVAAVVALIGTSVKAAAQQATPSPTAVAVTNCSGVTNCSSSSTAIQPVVTFSFDPSFSASISAPTILLPANGWSIVSTTCDPTQQYGGENPNSSCSVTLSFTSPTPAASLEKATLDLHYGVGACECPTPDIQVELDGNPVTGPNAVSLVSTPTANPAASGSATVTNGAAAASAYSVTVTIDDSGPSLIANSGPLRPSSEGFATTGNTCVATTPLNSSSGPTSCTVNFSFTNPTDATGPETIPLTYNFTDSNGYSWSVSDPVQGNPGAASSATLSSSSATPNLLVFNDLPTNTNIPPTITPSAAQTFTLTSKLPVTLNNVIIPTASGFASATGTTCVPGFQFTGGGSCTLNLTFTDPTIQYGTTTQPAIGPQKGTVYFLFEDNSFVTATVRGNPGPVSGALLTINSNDGTVNLAIYDSQIHNSNVQAPTAQGTCIASDTMFPTDAYFFDGGSWTGCDSGDAFEASLTPGGEGSPDGSATLGNFTVTTHYQCAPLFNGACNAPPMSSTGTSLTIDSGHGPVAQANPVITSSDSGFVTVTNNGPAFTGTIALTGISQDCGGKIVNSIINLAASGSPGSSVTLALAPDSSFCGGFEAQETMPITAGLTTVFPYGQDDYKLTPFNSVAGDQVTLMVVPYPDNPVSDPHVNTSIAEFDPGPNFPGYRCTPYTDLSGPNNPVCAGLQIGCVPGSTMNSATGDCETYIYSSELDYTVAPDDAENGAVSNAILNLGAPGFLGVHHQNFPPACNDANPEDPNFGSGCYNLNTLVSYNGDCCIKHTGGTDGSAHIDVWNPNFAPLTTLNIFTGFGSPVVDIGSNPATPNVNVIKAGRSVPLPFTQDDTTGAPVKNLSLCPSLSTTTAGACSDSTVQAPWVVVEAFAVKCPNTDNSVVDNTTFAAGASSLQNFSATTPGSYQYNWKTPSNGTGCARLVFVYNSGTAFVTPAEFQFK